MGAALSELTTLRLGGPAGRVVSAASSAELVDAVRGVDAAGESLLVVGGGSNLLVADEGWPGVVVLVRSRGVRFTTAPADGPGPPSTSLPGAVIVTAAAGEPWDDLVSATLAEGLSGLAAMSGIPGLTGATPVQNVGAYGSEVADSIVGLTVLDRVTGRIEPWSAHRCGFGFRTSAFKHTDRFVVLDVSFELARSGEGVPVRYLELARRLGVEPGGTAPSARVREVVLELRRSKGMLLDPDDHDTWSVGSFFVNPFVEPDRAPAGCPQWTVDGQVKLSAAWLISQAGFDRGYGLDRDYGRGTGRVGVSTKHSLALTNRGGASTAELLALAREIQAGVESRFDVWLRPEARLAGVSL